MHKKLCNSIKSPKIDNTYDTHMFAVFLFMQVLLRYNTMSFIFCITLDAKIMLYVGFFYSSHKFFVTQNC